MQNTGIPQPQDIVKPIQVKNTMPMMVGAGIIIVVLGLIVGYVVSKKGGVITNVSKSSGVSVTSTEAGVKDVTTIKDIKVTDAIGTLLLGGSKGVGSYHLERPGGATQLVYLTSTTVDMSPFVGKKVHIWGETQDNKNVPWFMDVIKIQVVQ